MSKYLKALEASGIEPNFWCSTEYFKHAQFEEIVVGLKNEGIEVLMVLDGEESMILPPINLNEGGIYPVVPKGGIWADLVGYSPKKEDSCHREFLDYNYIYDPEDFQELKGNKWKVFRKNSRKFPHRHGEENLLWATDEPSDKIGEFVSEVLAMLPDEEIHDADTLVNYIFKGKNRLFLLDKNLGKILALNIWDENYQYINYRYAFCVNQPFLSEYVRLCFYQMIHEKYSGKLVNDGGVLDRPSLKKFKDKLNPVKVNKIYSWKCRKNEKET